MKSALSIVLVLLSVLSVVGASAQSIVPPPQPGDVFVISREPGSASLGDRWQYYYACFENVIGPLVPFDIDYYVHVPETGGRGVSFQVVPPPGLFVLGREVLVDGAVDVSTVDDDEWVLDLGTCIAFTPFDQANPTDVSMFVPVVRYTFMHIGLPPDTPVCVEAIGDDSAPSWQDCEGATVAGGVWPPTFGSYSEGCGILEPTVLCPVDGEVRSWGTVKARFGG